MNIFDLSRNFWDFAFENPEKIKPNHVAMYFFAIEHCNRLGWKEKFGFPTTMAMDALGIKSYNTFISTLKDLVDYGFIKMVERSKNQYSANIIALSKFNNAQYKALNKAFITHSTKQSESTIQSTEQSTDSIDKPIYQYTNTQIDDVGDFENSEEIEKVKKVLKSSQITNDRLMMQYKISKDQLSSQIDEFVEKKFSWEENDWKNNGDLKKNFEFWLKTSLQNNNPGAAAEKITTNGKSRNNKNTNGNFNDIENSKRSLGGKTAARTILARRLANANSKIPDSDGGDIAIDAEIVE